MSSIKQIADIVCEVADKLEKFTKIVREDVVPADSVADGVGEWHTLYDIICWYIPAELRLYFGHIDEKKQYYHEFALWAFSLTEFSHSLTGNNLQRAISVSEEHRFLIGRPNLLWLILKNFTLTKNIKKILKKLKVDAKHCVDKNNEMSRGTEDRLCVSVFDLFDELMEDDFYNKNRELIHSVLSKHEFEVADDLYCLHSGAQREPLAEIKVAENPTKKRNKSVE